MMENIDDKYWKNICKLQEKQTEKGINTYGQTLEENKSLSVDQRFIYLEEELVDALMYIEHVRKGIKEETYEIVDALHQIAVIVGEEKLQEIAKHMDRISTAVVRIVK